MPHLARHLALAACLTLIGSVAEAAPKRHRGTVKAKKRHKALPEVVITDDAADDDATDDDATDDSDVDDEAEAPKKQKAVTRKKHKRARPRRHAADASETDQVGFKSDDAELVDAPTKIRKRAVKGPRKWNFAIGPNVWAASVEATVSVGAKDVSAAIDFFQLSRHTKYGVPVIFEGRYKRFSFVGDVLYGVVALEGGNEVGPLMVTLDGTVSNLSVDGIGGYRLLGDDASILSLEARGGVRYQRTAISGSVGVSGNGFPATIVDTATDWLAGARAFVRPSRWFYLAGTVDQSLFGTSTSTWSAGVDANLCISRVLVTAGWRTLTQQKSTISTVMSGPRVAVQLLF